MTFWEEYGANIKSVWLLLLISAARRKGDRVWSSMGNVNWSTKFPLPYHRRVSLRVSHMNQQKQCPCADRCWNLRWQDSRELCRYPSDKTFPSSLVDAEVKWTDPVYLSSRWLPLDRANDHYSDERQWSMMDVIHYRSRNVTGWVDVGVWLWVAGVRVEEKNTPTPTHPPSRRKLRILLWNTFSNRSSMSSISLTFDIKWRSKQVILIHRKKRVHLLRPAIDGIRDRKWRTTWTKVETRGNRKDSQVFSSVGRRKDNAKAVAEWRSARLRRHQFLFRWERRSKSKWRWEELIWSFDQPRMEPWCHRVCHWERRSSECQTNVHSFENRVLISCLLVLDDLLFLLRRRQIDLGDFQIDGTERDKQRRATLIRANPSSFPSAHIEFELFPEDHRRCSKSFSNERNSLVSQESVANIQSSGQQFRDEWPRCLAESTAVRRRISSKKIIDLFSSHLDWKIGHRWTWTRD